jgi:two-component system, NtrC family, sensor kinase
MSRSELQRDKMAQLGELTVGIAHELNNSIGYIASNLSSLNRYSQALIRLIERVETHLDPAERERWQRELAAARWEFIRDDLAGLIGETRAGADHLTHVVADLKVLARSSPSTEAVSLDACVASALTVLAHQTKHACVLERRLGAPRALSVVRSQLMQLAINLVLNAIQALPSSGGTIRLTTTDDGQTATMTVEDSGPGVDPALGDQIFEPYITTKPSGTGVGLAIARQVVATHGGTITLGRSAELGGACFTVRITGAATRRSETQPC